MGTETSVTSSVSTDAIGDHPHNPRFGLPERMLQKMGFYHHPVLIMLCLLASPYVVVYPICRQYCDAASCRYYRFNLYSALCLCFLFVIYRALERKENAFTIPTTGTQQQEEQTEKPLV